MKNIGPSTDKATAKMNPELKARWVEALRSGEFKQCGGTLHDRGNDAYCCWGVLREIAKPGDVRGRVTLTAVQLAEYGIPLDYPIGTLEDMNDGHNSIRKHSFSEIADYIEANL